MASFTVGIQAREQSIESQFPFAFRFILVLEIVFFKFGTNIDGGFEFSANISDVLCSCTQSWGNHAAIDVFTSSGYDFIAGHLDQDDKSGRSVVEFAQLIYFEESVHDGSKNLRKSSEFSSVISQLTKELS